MTVTITTAPCTHARVADLIEADRTLGAHLESVVNSPSVHAERAADELAALLGLPAPEPDTDGLRQCQALSHYEAATRVECGAWFWAEDGGEYCSYTGSGTATSSIDVCAEHCVWDDPEIAGLYLGSRLAERVGVAR